jgi:carnitine O-acetyltransferase
LAVRRKREETRLLLYSIVDKQGQSEIFIQLSYYHQERFFCGPVNMNQFMIRPSSLGSKPVSRLQRLLRNKKKQQPQQHVEPTTKTLKDLRSLSTASTSGSTSFSERSDDFNLTIPRWHVPMIESKGDYRDEAFLEEYIGGNLYKYQSSLPRLPIPAVADTIDKLMPTVLPLAKTPAEVEAVKSAAAKFPTEASRLQDRLINRREVDQKDSSWLQPWWNQMGYLQVRDSVVINVSYWFAFVDDDTTASSTTTTSTVPPNIQRAAAMMYSTGEFRREVVTGNLPAEELGRNKIPLDSTAYRYMFNACRIPHQVHDSYRIYDPSRHKHAIVARKGQFFAVDFVDDLGNPLPIEILQDQLLQCVHMADSIAADEYAKLGILTSTNRTSWADHRDRLLSVGGTAMQDAMQELESGAFVVNLDDTEPQNLDEHSEMLMTGGTVSGENRWFDKSMQLIIANNGKAGLLNEHSMMDGTY